jgi:hypothetical protein
MRRGWRVRQGFLAYATPIGARLGCRKGQGRERARVTPHQLTGSQQATTSPKLRPQPHSQVMDNGIATSFLAVDLFSETQVYRGCLR